MCLYYVSAKCDDMDDIGCWIMKAKEQINEVGDLWEASWDNEIGMEIWI